MQVLFDWFVKNGPWYFAGAALASFMMVLATSGMWSASRRSLVRSIVIAVLLAPAGIGSDNAVIIFPAWILLFSVGAPLAILPLLLVGGAAYALFINFAEATPRGKWIVSGIAALLVAGVVWPFMPRDHRPDPEPYREADASVYRTMERAMVTIERSVIIVQPPASLDADQLFVPQDITVPTRLRLRLGPGLLEGEAVSVRNPRTLEWIVLAPGDEVARELEVGPGDVLLVRRERPVELPPTEPVNLMVVEPAPVTP